MYEQQPASDVPRENIVQRFFAQPFGAIVLEIVMTIVVTVAASQAFDFFDPFAGETAASASTSVIEARHPLESVTESGVAYARAGRLQAAEAIFDWAVAIAPDEARSYAWRGYARLRTGDYAGAQADYRRWLEAEPRDFTGHSGLCWALGEIGEFASAERHCRRALDIAFNRTEFAIALENWCWLQVELGAYESAARDCRFSLEYAPEYEELRALAHYNLGRALLGLGQERAALRHFEAALRIGSSYEKMYLEIAAAYARLGYRPTADG